MKEIIEELNAVMVELQEKYRQEKEAVDWHNNNAANIGTMQTPYMPLPEYPENVLCVLHKCYDLLTAENKWTDDKVCEFAEWLDDNGFKRKLNGNWMTTTSMFNFTTPELLQKFLNQ